MNTLESSEDFMFHFDIRNELGLLEQCAQAYRAQGVNPRKFEETYLTRKRELEELRDQRLAATRAREAAKLKEIVELSASETAKQWGLPVGDLVRTAEESLLPLFDPATHTFNDGGAASAKSQ